SSALTTLAWNQEDAEPPDSLLEGIGSFRVRNLSIYASRYKNLITNRMPEPDGEITITDIIVRASNYWGNISPAEVDKRFREGLAISSGGGDLLRLTGPNISISHCDLYGSGRALALIQPRNASVHNNK